MTNQTPIDSSEFVGDLKLEYYHDSNQMAIYVPLAMKEMSRLMQISVDSIRKQDAKTYENFLQMVNKFDDPVKRQNRLRSENDRYKALEGNRIAKKLNDCAKTFCEDLDDKSLLLNALTWSRRSAEYRKDVKFIETQAAILVKLGRQEAAMTLLEQEVDNGKSPAEMIDHLNKIVKAHTRKE